MSNINGKKTISKRFLAFIAILALFLSVFATSTFNVFASEVTTAEWNITAPDETTKPVISNTDTGGYSVSLGAKSFAQFRFAFDDIKVTEEKKEGEEEKKGTEFFFAPKLSKEFMKSGTGNLGTVLHFSTNPNANIDQGTQEDVIQLRPFFVRASQNVHRQVFFPHQAAADTLGAWSFGYFGYDDNYEPDYAANLGATFSFVKKTGLDGEQHTYLNMFIPRVGDFVLQQTDEANEENLKRDKHLQFDRFQGKPVYFTFGVTSADDENTKLDCYFKNPEANTAKEQDKEEIQKIDTAIEALPAVNDFTLEDKDKVENVTGTMNTLGSSSAFIKKVNYEKYLALLKQIDILDGTQAVQDFEASMDALIEPENLTAENYAENVDSVTKAFKQRNALSDTSLDKVNADKLKKLENLKEKLSEFDSDYKKIVDTEKNIETLGKPEDFKIEDFDLIKTKTENARQVYDNLSESLMQVFDKTILSLLLNQEKRVEQLAEVVDVVNEIKTLPAIDKIQISDDVAIMTAYNNYEALGNDKKLVDATSTKKLLDARQKIIDLVSDIGDWYVSDDELIKYTGNAEKGWEFTPNNGKGNWLFATTTANYNLNEDIISWQGPTSGAGSWFSLVLTTDISKVPDKGAKLPKKEDDDIIMFILRPQGSNLMVSCWSPSEESPEAQIKGGSDTGNLYGFDHESLYNFSFIRQDGHWYLKINDHLFNGRTFDHLDDYLNKNASMTKIGIGGEKGFRANKIKISSNKTLSEEWTFSNSDGAAISGSLKLGWDITVPGNSYAQYNTPFKNLEKNPITVNFNVDKNSWAPVISFAKKPDSKSPPEKADGVSIRLVNRPDSDPNNTHVLVSVPGNDPAWPTLFAVPAVGDKDIKFSCAKDADGHYYLYLDGKKIAFSEEKASLNEHLWMDDLIGDSGAYIRVGSLSQEEATITVRFPLGDNIDPDGPDEDDVQKFLDLLDKHFEAAKAGDKKALSILANAWNNLSYVDQLSVEAHLLDNDQDGYNLLQIIKDFADSGTPGIDNGGNGSSDSGNSGHGGTVNTGVVATTTALLIIIISLTVAAISKRKTLN